MDCEFSGNIQNGRKIKKFKQKGKYQQFRQETNMKQNTNNKQTKILYQLFKIERKRERNLNKIQ